MNICCSVLAGNLSFSGSQLKIGFDSASTQVAKVRISSGASIIQNVKTFDSEGQTIEEIENPQEFVSFYDILRLLVILLTMD